MRIGIRIQLFIMVGLLIAGVAGVTSLVALHSQREAIIKERELRGMSLLRSWAAMSHERLASGDELLDLQIYDFIDIVMKDEAGVVSLIMQDDKGKILFANDPSRNGTTPVDTIFQRLLHASKPGNYHVKINEEMILEFYAPILSKLEKGKRIGVARLSFSSAGIEEGIKESLLRLIFVSMAVVFVGFVLVFILVMKITGPVKKLTHGVQEFGKLFDPNIPATADYQIEFSARNELADVRDAFNEMTKTLKASLENGIRLKDEATHDAMTGLFNKRQFQDDYPTLIRVARERKSPLAMMMIDMDKFKQLNDTVGHKAGDIALQLLAKCITGKIREKDRAYRVGGDEFVICLVGAGLDVAVNQSLRIAEVYDSEKAPENMTGISFGIVEYNGKETPEEFFARADAEMYRVKREKKAER